MLPVVLRYCSILYTEFVYCYDNNWSTKLLLLTLWKMSVYFTLREVYAIYLWERAYMKVDQLIILKFNVCMVEFALLIYITFILLFQSCSLVTGSYFSSKFIQQSVPFIITCSKIPYFMLMLFMDFFSSSQVI